MKRFVIEPDYHIQEGCKCGSCWEHNGNWLGIDMEDIEEDVIFNTQQEAEEWLMKKVEEPYAGHFDDYGLQEYYKSIEEGEDDGDF